MARTKQKTEKVNLNLQITRDMLEDFDAAMALLHPNVNVRPSRSQAVREAMLEYIAQAPTDAVTASATGGAEEE